MEETQLIVEPGTFFSKGEIIYGFDLLDLLSIDGKFKEVWRAIKDDHTFIIDEELPEDKVRFYAFKGILDVDEVIKKDSPGATRNIQRLKNSIIPKFIAETNALKTLEHENIAKLHAHGRVKQRDPITGKMRVAYIIVEDLVNGPTLKDDLDSRLSCGLNNFRNDFHNCYLAVKYTKEIASALACMVSNEPAILHGDMKPNNMLISRDEDKIVLTDYGNAKLLHARGYYQEGNELYASPEQLELRLETEDLSGADNLGAATDVFGLGCVTYEMLTGIHPFKGVNKEETVRNIMEKIPKKPTNLLPDTHPIQQALMYEDEVGRIEYINVEHLIMRMLEKSATKRVQPYEVAHTFEKVQNCLLQYARLNN